EEEAGKGETSRRGNGEAQGGAWRRARCREESEGRIVTACTMTKKPQVRPDGFVLFDVLYEDGTQTSNRKVPASELGGLDGDLPARTFVEARSRNQHGVRQTARAHQVDQPLTEDDKMRSEDRIR